MQLYLRLAELVVVNPSAARFGKSWSMPRSVTTLFRPTEPGRCHFFDLASIRLRNGIRARNGLQRPEPMLRFPTEFPEDQWKCRLAHHDDLLIRRMHSHRRRGGCVGRR